MKDVFKQSHITENRKYNDSVAQNKNGSSIPIIMASVRAIVPEAYQVLKKLKKHEY